MNVETKIPQTQNDFYQQVKLKLDPENRTDTQLLYVKAWNNYSFVILATPQSKKEEKGFVFSVLEMIPHPYYGIELQSMQAEDILKTEDGKKVLTFDIYLTLRKNNQQVQSEFIYLNKKNEGSESLSDFLKAGPCEIQVNYHYRNLEDTERLNGTERAVLETMRLMSCGKHMH